MAEGAIDCHNKAITPDYIKEVSEQTSRLRSSVLQDGFRFHIFTTVVSIF